MINTSRRKDHKIFNHTAATTKAANVYPMTRRGGIRM